MAVHPEEKGVATPLCPTDIIVFGGNGDLSLRKVLPALYYRHKDGQLPAKSRIIAIGRSPLSRDAYLQQVESHCREHVDAKNFTAPAWRDFSSRIDYLSFDAGDASQYHILADALAKNTCEGRVFYLATPSQIFATICAHLKTAGLITPQSRVVLEKPLGSDLPTFRHINGQVLQCFDESQVYRIDHYLGKETVQNLMIIRFANHLFERVWNGDVIDHVQITVVENIGVEARGGYFDNAGILRDMVQNHLLQLLCLVAMEPPSHVDPHWVRDEKVKVLRALRPMTKKNILKLSVRGQYASGEINGETVPSYLEDIGKKESDTETFVAIKTYIDNWRWSGVPFYLRTGKRMAERFSEIVLQFRPVPHQIFPGQTGEVASNRLVIRLQPDESVKLQMVTKVPGPGGYRLQPVNLNLSLTDTFKERYPGPYERLLMDVVRGNPTLFMRSDEVEASWQWIDSIISSWKEQSVPPLLYPAGSWGPAANFQLIERNKRHWHDGDTA